MNPSLSTFATSSIDNAPLVSLEEVKVPQCPVGHRTDLRRLAAGKWKFAIIPAGHQIVETQDGHKAVHKFMLTQSYTNERSKTYDVSGLRLVFAKRRCPAGLGKHLSKKNEEKGKKPIGGMSVEMDAEECAIAQQLKIEIAHRLIPLLSDFIPEGVEDKVDYLLRRCYDPFNDDKQYGASAWLGFYCQKPEKGGYPMIPKIFKYGNQTADNPDYLWCPFQPYESTMKAMGKKWGADGFKKLFTLVGKGCTATVVGFVDGISLSVNNDGDFGWSFDLKIDTIRVVEPPSVTETLFAAQDELMKWETQDAHGRALMEGVSTQPDPQSDNLGETAMSN